MWHTVLKIRLLMGLAPALGAVLWMGWDGGETYYEKPPAEVMSALSSAHVPTHVLGSHVEGSRVTMPDGKTVVTALIDKDGRELMRFVTTATADGAGSLVDTVLEAPKGEHAERAAEAMKTHALEMSLMEKLADEHVAAAIEGRAFDMTFGASPMAKGILEANPAFREQTEAANRAAAEVTRQIDQMEFEAEYGDDWGESSATADEGWAE